MKARIVAVALIGLGCYSAIGQEYDDVYFSKKDRDKQQALKPKTLKTLDKSSEDYPVLAKANRKVEGYTGRTINPDYQSKYSTGTEVSSYFVPNYQPRVANSGFGSMYAGNSCLSCYNNNWGMSNRFGYGMYSPFYSPFSSAWGYSPYGYNSFWNDPWNNYGYNSWNSWGFGSPYSSWGNPYYNSGWGWNMGYTYGWGNGFYGGWYSNSFNNYYVINRPDNSTPRTYGKRSSRNDGMVNNNSMSRGSQVVSGGQNTNPSRGGRVATTSGSTSTANRYYQRGWRQDPSINPAGNTTSGSRSSGWVGGSGNSGRSSSPWGNFNNGSSRSSWNNDTFGGSNNSGSFSTGGSRSSGASFGGGSSGGGSRSGGSSSGTRGRN